MFLYSGNAVYSPYVEGKIMAMHAILHIDPSAAFVGDFIPLPQRKNILKRVLGTLGLEMRKAE